VLDAMLVRPARSTVEAAVLICHGIGETVESWRPVQDLLAAQNIASLVFDYSGYGRSTGRIDADQCESDVISAFGYLRQQMPATAISVLGFSLGSGIAAAVIQRITPNRLILCAAFTSIREAARGIGLPRIFTFLLPPIWNTEVALGSCTVPVLIVHSEKDRLFPPRMSSDLARACQSPCELIIVPGLLHNAAWHLPKPSYWSAIVFYLRQASRPLSEHSRKDGYNSVGQAQLHTQGYIARILWIAQNRDGHLAYRVVPATPTTAVMKRSMAVPAGTAARVR
jgi:alpha-beta hydrolase superfamily lysophospholipase